MAHIKRITVGWGGKKPLWVPTPHPGPHPKNDCITPITLFVNRLKIADNAREVRYILRKGYLLIDGKVIKDRNFPIGLMDVVSIPKIKKSYILLPSKKGIMVKEAKSENIKSKLCRIINKTSVKNGKIRVGFHDGRNILIGKEDKDKYHVGDTVQLTIPSQKIENVFKFEKGNPAVITHGRYAGEFGTIQDIIAGTRTGRSITIVDKMATLTEYIFVVGDKTSSLNV